VNTQHIVRDVRRRLKAQADPKRAEGERRYFKETIRSYGVTVPQSQALAKEVFREHADELSEGDWLALAEALLATGWFEEGTVGLSLVERARPAPSDALFATYARWLEMYVGNWAHGDDLCGSLVGRLLLERPALARRLRPWTKSKNRWLRRGAAVSLTGPARRGLFLEEALGIAEALLGDNDDLVQKGYGWLLREAAKTHEAEVTAFLERHVARIGRTAFRYAIEKYPPDERKRLMAL
jgi:3-methyladenine DNA glycosylase AlkD